MLNIGRLGPSRGADYYLKVGSGVDDYYVGGSEAQGRWAGTAAAELGLHGVVGAQAFRSLLAGVDPFTGKVLGSPGRSIPGFDLTFRPPKSVSILWALAEREVAAEVIAGHDAAVAAALGYVEGEVVRSRRGRAGAESVDVTGVVAAVFPHRTSRAGDPLVHGHVVVVNAVRAVDAGVWRTLDSRRLYRHAKTAGHVYQAALRAELTRRLGVEWGPLIAGSGAADLVGFSRPLIVAFSQRRTQILDAMAGVRCPPPGRRRSRPSRRGRRRIGR